MPMLLIVLLLIVGIPFVNRGLGCGLAYLVLALPTATVVLFIIISILNRAPGTGWGTHICNESHFDRQGNVCIQDDKALSTVDISTAYLVFTEQDGKHFQGNSGVIIVDKDEGTNLIPLGRVPIRLNPSMNISSISIKSVFSSARVAVQMGSTYTLEFDEDIPYYETVPIGSADIAVM